MNEADKAELRSRLEEQMVRLKATLTEIDGHERESLSEASGENAYRDHMADQGSATFERELENTFEEDDREKLEQVVAALRRLDSGTYGICNRCGVEIPSARLLAVPTAVMCVRCKAQDESR